MMARLITSSATIEISPSYRESQLSKWVDTVLALEYHIQEKSIKFDFPSNKVSLTISDFDGMCNGIQEYIMKLPARPLKSPNHPLQDFRFMPFESSFEIRVYGGYFFNDECQDGMVYLEFKVALKSLGASELRGHHFGCSVLITILSLQKFIEDLENELASLSVE